MVPNPAFNPFTLLMDPASVLRAVACSPGLGSLQTRVFRPLDRKGQLSVADIELAAYDAEVDAVDVADVVVVEEQNSSMSDPFRGDTTIRYG